MTNNKLKMENLEKIFKLYPEIKLVYFFGSKANGKSGPLSDYDFAFYVAEKDKKKMSIIKIELMKDPIYRDKIIKAVLKSLMKRPTSYEKKISELCIENNLPFIYAGNGTFLIGHKNPDFVNKEKRIAIEVYHNYFKIIHSCPKLSLGH